MGRIHGFWRRREYILRSRLPLLIDCRNNWEEAEDRDTFLKLARYTEPLKFWRFSHSIQRLHIQSKKFISVCTGRSTLAELLQSTGAYAQVTSYFSCLHNFSSSPKSDLCVVTWITFDLERLLRTHGAPAVQDTEEEISSFESREADPI